MTRYFFIESKFFILPHCEKLISQNWIMQLDIFYSSYLFIFFRFILRSYLMPTFSSRLLQFYCYIVARFCYSWHHFLQQLFVCNFSGWFSPYTMFWRKVRRIHVLHIFRIRSWFMPKIWYVIDRRGKLARDFSTYDIQGDLLFKWLNVWKYSFWPHVGKAKMCFGGLHFLSFFSRLFTIFINNCSPPKRILVTKMGSEMHVIRVIAIWISKFWFASPCSFIWHMINCSFQYQ